MQVIHASIKVIAALERTKRAQRSTMGKKIWLTMHPRNFGSHVTVRTAG